MRLRKLRLERNRPLEAGQRFILAAERTRGAAQEYVCA